MNLRDLSAFFPTPRRTSVFTHNRRVDGCLNISFFAATFSKKKTSATLHEKLARWGLEMDRRLRQTRARHPSNCDARRCIVRKCFCCIISLHSRTRKTLAAVAALVFVRDGLSDDGDRRDFESASTRAQASDALADAHADSNEHLVSDCLRCFSWMRTSAHGDGVSGDAGFVCKEKESSAGNILDLGDERRRV